MDKRGAHHLGLGHTADMTETGGGYDLGVPFAADPPRDIEIQLVAAVFRLRPRADPPLQMPPWRRRSTTSCSVERPASH